MRCKILLLVSFACCAILSGCATSSQPSTTIELHHKLPTTLPLAGAGSYGLVQCEINSQNAGWFLVDTGANLTVVDRGTANRFKLPITSQGRTAGIAGYENFNFRQVDTFSSSGFTWPITRVAALNLRSLRRVTGTTINGIVGLDALRREIFTLDHQAGTLTLGDTFDETAHTETFVPHHGLAFVHATLGDGRKVLLLLDTGADNELTLHTDVVQRWPDVLAISQSGPTRSSGVGGQVAGAKTWASQVELLGVTLKDVPISIDPPPPGLASDARIAGRVGNKLLRHFKITIDPRSGRISAVWRP